MRCYVSSTKNRIRDEKLRKIVGVAVDFGLAGRFYDLVNIPTLGTYTQLYLVNTPKFEALALVASDGN